MPIQSKYIYGIIEEPQPRRFGFRGVEDAEVYAINYEDLAAVVSDNGLTEIYPTRRNVLAHTTVQDEFLKKYTFLPMGFGMIATSEDNVRRLLEKNYEALAKELERLAGKIEAELKIFWDEKAMVGENQELLSKLKTKISSASSAVEAQRLAIEAGMVVERIVREWKAKYAGQVYNSLKGLAIDARLNNPAGVKNILNASFLIERVKEHEFVEQVRRLDAEHRGKMNFKYVGPLSPYNFVDLRLELVS
ncbi:MAG: GvpL/GvpF family gas vesicle protein [Chloroflexi bacterium]|nr:GvpL/GvpF family gas vesicle protein [Chloroflexota bacterium]